MICTECLNRIAELERLERVYQEIHKTFRDKAQSAMSERQHNDLAIQERDAKLDKLICRLELKRHQRHHVMAKPPCFEYSRSIPISGAAA